MKAGFFETDITPAVGMETPGGYGKAYAVAFHDPLKVRAAVFADGEERVALVGIDTCAIAARTVAAARLEIEARCGIKGSHVTIGASHTHSGGPLFGFLPDEVADAPALVQDLVLKHSTVADPLYHTWVVRQIVTAVCEADRRQTPALIAVGRGHEDAAVFNRRLRMQDGRSVSHPGKGNPGIVAPAGPVDPEVGVLAAWRPDGALLGCVINYACHGTTSPGGLSADWIHYLERTVRRAMGPDVVTVFLNGACGDVTQVDNRSLAEPEFGEHYAQRVGTRVGAEVLKVLVTAPKGDAGKVAAATTVLRMPRRRPSPLSLERSRALILQEINEPHKTTAWTFAKERLILDYMIGKEPEVAVEVQALQVGPAVFLANPSEYFCQLGLDLKRQSPFPFTFVVELANAGVGYVPTEEAFQPTGGGYETVLTTYSNLPPDAGTRIAAASLALARQLTPTPVPQRPQVTPATAAWSYGVLGPELE